MRKNPAGRFAMACLVALLLAACGGGGGDGDDGDDGGEDPPPGPTVTLTGTVRFARVPFQTLPGAGLDYANPVLQPARGVAVRALNAATQAVLVSGSTDASGAYSLQVPDNANVVIQVMARMQRGTAQSLPRWDVRVQDGLNAAAPFTYNGAAFNSSAGVHNVDIPTGLSATGTATGPRASGPFAILDTIYTAIQTVTSVEPSANLPMLVVDWGSQTGGSYFGVQGGTQLIALNWNLTEDTEEFDQHVIAHEYGHYVEHNFSRFDSIGGEHGLGDRLDLRVAFSEGFGYAFAAIALNDPVLRDSYVDGGVQVESRIPADSNPTGSPANANGGCWCSESSVWSILWDLYDAPNDGADNVQLGFQPLWDALKGTHRQTPAVASIFSYISALKAAQPAQASAIEALVSAQNINAELIDEFANSETSTPEAQALPLFTAITPGAPVVVRTLDNRGRHNKVGNRRLLQFTPVSSGNVTVSVTTSNPNGPRDPDFLVRRSGTIIVIAESDAIGTETAAFNATAGQTYIIDAYDCANGCDEDQGTPGDYDLTVTIN